MLTVGVAIPHLYMKPIPDLTGLLPGIKGRLSIKLVKLSKTSKLYGKEIANRASLALQETHTRPVNTGLIRGKVIVTAQLVPV